MGEPLWMSHEQFWRVEYVPGPSVIWPVGAVNVTKVLVQALELIGAAVCPGDIGAAVCPGDVGAWLGDDVGAAVIGAEGGGVIIGGTVPPVEK
jgi:hypothetical protein